MKYLYRITIDANGSKIKDGTIVASVYKNPLAPGRLCIYEILWCFCMKSLGANGTIHWHYERQLQDPDTYFSTIATVTTSWNVNVTIATDMVRTTQFLVITNNNRYGDHSNRDMTITTELHPRHSVLLLFARVFVACGVDLIMVSDIFDYNLQF